MKPIMKIKIIASVVTVASGASIAYYAINDSKTKSARIDENQSVVMNSVSTKDKFEKIKTGIDKKVSSIIDIPIRQTYQDAQWEKAADKIRLKDAFAEGKEAGVDSMKSVMEKIIDEKVKVAIDRFKKAQKAIDKKAKNIGKKNTKDAKDAKNSKNAKNNNNKQTNKAKNNINKAAKNFIKQKTKQIKK